MGLKREEINIGDWFIGCSSFTTESLPVERLSENNYNTKLLEQIKTCPKCIKVSPLLTEILNLTEPKA